MQVKVLRQLFCIAEYHLHCISFRVVSFTLKAHRNVLLSGSLFHLKNENTFPFSSLGL